MPERLTRLTEIQASVDRLEHTAAQMVPREQLRRTLGTMVTVAAVTLLLTLATENFAIRACFINPPNTGTTRAVCGAIFPGFADARKQADERLRVFQDNIRRLDDHERRLERLERPGGHREVAGHDHRAGGAARAGAVGRRPQRRQGGLTGGT